MKVRDRQKIAREFYGVDEVFLKSWIPFLVYIRNLCAHYARLYDRSLTRWPRLFKEDRSGISLAPRGKIIEALLVCKRICQPPEEWVEFLESLESLIEAYKDHIELERLGFPHEGWKSLLKDL